MSAINISTNNFQKEVMNSDKSVLHPKGYKFEAVPI